MHRPGLKQMQFQGSDEVVVETCETPAESPKECFNWAELPGDLKRSVVKLCAPRDIGALMTADPDTYRAIHSDRRILVEIAMSYLDPRNYWVAWALVRIQSILAEVEVQSGCNAELEARTMAALKHTIDTCNADSGPSSPSTSSRTRRKSRKDDGAIRKWRVKLMETSWVGLPRVLSTCYHAGVLSKNSLLGKMMGKMAPVRRVDVDFGACGLHKTPRAERLSAVSLERALLLHEIRLKLRDRNLAGMVDSLADGPTLIHMEGANRWLNASLAALFDASGPELRYIFDAEVEEVRTKRNGARAISTLGKASTDYCFCDTYLRTGLAVGDVKSQDQLFETFWLSFVRTQLRPLVCSLTTLNAICDPATALTRPVLGQFTKCGLVTMMKSHVYGAVVENQSRGWEKAVNAKAGRYRVRRRESKKCTRVKAEAEAWKKMNTKVEDGPIKTWLDKEIEKGLLKERQREYMRYRWQAVSARRVVLPTRAINALLASNYGSVSQDTYLLQRPVISKQLGVEWFLADQDRPRLIPVQTGTYLYRCLQDMYMIPSPTDDGLEGIDVDEDGDDAMLDDDWLDTALIALDEMESPSWTDMTRQARV